MNEMPRPRFEREAAQWLANGPTDAPASLLGKATERTRRTRQRAGWLALALGAPLMPADGLPVGLVGRRSTWLVVALALLVVASIIVAAGGMSRNDRPVVVVVRPTPSSLPQALPTVPPAETPAASEPAGGGCFVRPPQSCDPNVTDVVDTSLGFTFTGGPDWSIQPTGPGESRVFGFGQCWDRICRGGYLTVAVFPVGAGFTVDASPPGAASGLVSHRITGTTLAKLAASWTKAYPGTSPAPALVDGVPAIVVSTDLNLYVLAIHGNRLYTFMSAGPAFLPPNPRLILASDGVLSGFLAGFRFLDPGSTSAPSSGSLGDLALSMPDGWMVSLIR